MATVAVASRIEVLVWVFLYGGLLVACVGFALMNAGAWYGWIVVAAGLFDAVVGVVLVWVRSRLTGPPPHRPTEGTP